MNKYVFKLHIDKEHRLYQPNHVTIRQGDRKGCQIEAKLYDHGVRFTQGGLSAYFVMELPDQIHYYRELATYVEGIVTVTIDESKAAVVTGVSGLAYFELRDGDTLIATTENLMVTIEPSATGGKLPGDTYDDAIERALSDLAEGIDAATTATSAASGAAADASSAADAAGRAATAANAIAAVLERTTANATTLAPGSDATVSYSNGVFSFGIPAGDPATEGSITARMLDVTPAYTVDGSGDLTISLT